MRRVVFLVTDPRSLRPEGCRPFSEGKRLGVEVPPPGVFGILTSVKTLENFRYMYFVDARVGVGLPRVLLLRSNRRQTGPRIFLDTTTLLRNFSPSGPKFMAETENGHVKRGKT